MEAKKRKERGKGAKQRIKRREGWKKEIRRKVILGMYNFDAHDNHLKKITKISKFIHKLERLP